MYRIAFDPALPVVTTSAITLAGRRLASGDELDWRALGITEQTLFALWSVGQIVHPIRARQTESVIEMPGVADSALTMKLDDAERAEHTAAELSDEELERLTRPE